MKKFLAVLLSIITIFSVFALPASALDGLGDLAGGLLGGEEEGTNQIQYKVDTLDSVSLFYQAGNTLVVDGSKYAHVTYDTPIALDHDFICWTDDKGKRYYPGDVIKVEGTVTLYAVWEEKTDNDGYMVRVVKASIAALKRIISLILGVFEDAKEFDDAYWESVENQENNGAVEDTDIPAVEETTAPAAA